MPKSAAHPYVPLTCNLCPKQPKFSDVSHLLTHVSSKSHLSCKFDLSIKAQADPAIGHQLAAYDHWFETYGIARLLADRMASKENKKNGIKTKKPTKAQSNRRNAESRNEENINPALFGQQGSQVYRPPMPVMQSVMQHDAMQRQMNPWATVDPNRGTPDVASDWHEESAFGTPFETPTMRNNVPNFGAFQHNGAAVAEEIDDTSVGDHDSQDDDEDDPHRVAPASRLKGVVLPGMDLFDSATPEMRRLRNQKKDGSILQGMLFTSNNTPAIEVVWSTDFSFRKNRNIDGENESDEEEFVAPTPAKRKTRGKKAMKKVDGNKPRMQKLAAAGGRKPGLRSRSKAMSYDENSPVEILSHSFATALSTSGSTSSHTTPSASTESRYAPSIDEEDDYFVDHNPRKKVKHLKVFRDREEIELQLAIENGEPRSGTESPLEDHRFEEFPMQPAFYPQPEPSKHALTSPVPNAYRQNQAHDKYSYDGAMDYSNSRDVQDDDNLDQLYVTEQETPRQSAPYGQGAPYGQSAQYGQSASYGQSAPFGQSAPYGLAAPQQFPPAYTQQQYFHDNATVNPLKAQSQAHHPSHNSGYHSGHQASSTYQGNFKPVTNNGYFYPTSTPYYDEPASGSSGKAEALTPNSNDQNPFYS